MTGKRQVGNVRDPNRREERPQPVKENRQGDGCGEGCRDGGQRLRGDGEERRLGRRVGREEVEEGSERVRLQQEFLRSSNAATEKTRVVSNQ